MLERDIGLLQRQRQARGFQVRFQHRVLHCEFAGVPGEVKAFLRFRQQGQQVREVPGPAPLPHFQDRLLEGHFREIDPVPHERGELRAYHGLRRAEEIALGKIGAPGDAGLPYDDAFEGGERNALELDLPAELLRGLAVDLADKIRGDLLVFKISESPAASQENKQRGGQYPETRELHT